VRSLAQNLAGSIADQTFSYDKEESLDFEFGGPSQGSKEVQQLKTFENCLSGATASPLQRSEIKQTLPNPISNFGVNSFNMNSVSQENFIGDILQPMCDNVQLPVSQPTAVFDDKAKVCTIQIKNKKTSCLMAFLGTTYFA